MHGKDGEDGVAQSFFEYLRIPYTHSGIISSFNAMNKIISKEIFIKNNIKTPRFFSLKKSLINKKKILRNLKKKRINFPVVVKPIDEGSSLGVMICQNIKKLLLSIRLLFKSYNELIFEEYKGGQEIQVAVINGTALGAIELVPKRLFYDYKAKYSRKAKTKHNASKIPKNKYIEVLKIAKKAIKC